MVRRVRRPVLAAKAMPISSNSATFLGTTCHVAPIRGDPSFRLRPRMPVNLTIPLAIFCGDARDLLASTLCVRVCAQSVGIGPLLCVCAAQRACAAKECSCKFVARAARILMCACKSLRSSRGTCCCWAMPAAVTFPVMSRDSSIRAARACRELEGACPSRCFPRWLTLPLHWWAMLAAVALSVMPRDPGARAARALRKLKTARPGSCFSH